MARPQSALIADDEQHVRVYLRMMLNQLGVDTIYEAADGTSAVEVYYKYRPDVVLLDIVMPGLTAPSVMQDLKALRPDVPVVVVTAQVSLKSVQEMHALGAIAYILKHTPRDQMLKMLAEALDSI